MLAVVVTNDDDDDEDGQNNSHHVLERRTTTYMYVCIYLGVQILRFLKLDFLTFDIHTLMCSTLYYNIYAEKKQ